MLNLVVISFLILALLSLLVQSNSSQIRPKTLRGGIDSSSSSPFTPTLATASNNNTIFTGAGGVPDDDTVKARYAKDKRTCTSMMANYNVKPGVDWGTMLKKETQDRWIELNCDKFFCQKNKLAGKGIYKCLPLEEYAKLRGEISS